MTGGVVQKELSWVNSIQKKIMVQSSYRASAWARWKRDGTFRLLPREATKGRKASGCKGNDKAMQRYQRLQ
jgi:hypothetical protein